MSKLFSKRGLFEGVKDMKCTKCDGDGWTRTDVEGQYLKCDHCDNEATPDIPRLCDPLRDPQLSWMRRNDNDRRST